MTNNLHLAQKTYISTEELHSTVSYSVARVLATASHSRLTPCRHDYRKAGITSQYQLYCGVSSDGDEDMDRFNA